ncbi:MAG: hypothetical protein IIZ92_22570 [Aquincola sp.]|nr:hypothetical protein [Aquincola sp.]|tara:strand:- start:3533 stop:4036 length:504 start_codon:yes stop_codon:yes gene_type:complete
MTALPRHRRSAGQEGFAQELGMRRRASSGLAHYIVRAAAALLPRIDNLGDDTYVFKMPLYFNYRIFSADTNVVSVSPSGVLFLGNGCAHLSGFALPAVSRDAMLCFFEDDLFDCRLSLEVEPFSFEIEPLRPLPVGTACKARAVPDYPFGGLAREGSCAVNTCSRMC